MIFAHGNKSIIGIFVMVFIVFSSLCACKIFEIKMEIKKNMKEYDFVTSSLEENNRKIVNGAGL